MILVGVTGEKVTEGLELLTKFMSESSLRRLFQKPHFFNLKAAMRRMEGGGGDCTWYKLEGEELPTHRLLPGAMIPRRGCPYERKTERLILLAGKPFDPAVVDAYETKKAASEEAKKAERARKAREKRAAVKAARSAPP